eukprot:scaffold5360_cov213-Amphora_coffeaeformis.AAC.4
MMIQLLSSWIHVLMLILLSLSLVSISSKQLVNNVEDLGFGRDFILLSGHGCGRGSIVGFQ